MGKNKKRRNHKREIKQLNRLTKIDVSKRIIDVINKNNIDCPIELCEDYQNLLGNKIPDSHEDIDNVIDILLLHYNRVTNSYEPDKQMLIKIKKSLINLAQLFNYYIYDVEIIKLLKVINMIEDDTSNDPEYIKHELNFINSNLKMNEKKFYTRLLARLQNKSVQIRYLNGLISNIKIENEFNKNKEEKLDNEFIDSVLNDLDNLKI